jgi:two-component system response regulator RegA
VVHQEERDSLAEWRFLARALSSAHHEFTAAVTSAVLRTEAVLEELDESSIEEVRRDLRLILQSLRQGASVLETVRSIAGRCSLADGDVAVLADDGTCPAQRVEHPAPCLAASRVFVVEDDPVFRATLMTGLRDHGLEVATAGSVEEAWAEIWDFDPDLVTVDLQLADQSGLTFLRDICHRDPDLKVVVMSACVGLSTAVTAMRLGAEWVLAKPFTADALVSVFERIHRPPEVCSATTFERLTVEEAEREVIERALRDTGGNKAEAARQLGIHRRTLDRKLDRWREQP